MQSQTEVEPDHSFTILALVLVLLSTLIFIFPTIAVWNQSDYITHLRWTRELAETTRTENGHTAFQQITIIVRALIPFNLLKVFGNQFDLIWPNLSYQIAGLIVVILFNNCLVLLIFHRIKNRFSFLSKNKLLFLCFLLPLTLVTVSPISIFTLAQRNLYLGYIGINVYHNPTVILLKTFSVLLFWLIMDHFQETNSALKQIVGISSITILNIISKPVYIICFVPVIVFMTFVRSIRKKNVNYKLMIFGLIIPSVILLSILFLATYRTDDGGGIAFAPFEVIHQYIPTIGGSISRLILSITFPLMVLVLFYKRILLEPRLIAAYGTLLISILLMYLFKETGERMNHGNFWWGAEVSLLIVFIEGVLLCINEFSKLTNRALIRNHKFWLICSIFLMHFVSGIVWVCGLTFGSIDS